jgi:predicted nucleotidyltransferase
MSVVSKLASGRNASDAVDLKLYELRNFVKLALDNNPNIIETLFVPRKNIVEMDDIMANILKNKQMFLHKGLAKKFIGYAKSQLHKMNVKPDNYKALTDARDYLKDLFAFGGLKGNTPVSLLQGSGCPNFIKFDNFFVAIGDMKFNPQVKLTDVVDMCEARISKATSRTDGYTKYGYDTKFAMHCLRLLYEGIELLETANVTFPLKHREFLLEVRAGKHEVKNILEIAENLVAQVDEMVEKSSLPEKPRFDEVNKLLINMVEEYHAR